MEKGRNKQRPPKNTLPYCPDLGRHHMFYEARKFKRPHEKTLRSFGAFILEPLIDAPPPQHTLLHRSLGPTPMPNRNEAYDLLDTAKHGGLEAVVDEIDSDVTEHLRRQLGILAIPKQEAIERLTSKHYVTEIELRKMGL